MVAWWAVLMGPVAVAAASAIAGVLAGSVSVVFVFPIAVWALTILACVAVSPPRPDMAWVARSVLLSLVVAGLALGLAWSISKVASDVSQARKGAVTLQSSMPEHGTGMHGLVSSRARKPPRAPACERLSRCYEVRDVGGSPPMSGSSEPTSWRECSVNRSSSAGPTSTPAATKIATMATSEACGAEPFERVKPVPGRRAGYWATPSPTTPQPRRGRSTGAGRAPGG